MSGILIIGPEDEAIIEQALVAARANPLPWRVAKDIVQDNTDAGHVVLKDRKPGVDAVRKVYARQQIMLGTYRCALSFEEQPAGIFKHLSVSSDRKDKVPGPDVMQMVAEAFGFSEHVSVAMRASSPNLALANGPVFRIWLEEFEPGHLAINIIELLEELQ